LEAIQAGEKLRQEVSPVGFQIMRRDGKASSSGERQGQPRVSVVINEKRIIPVQILLI
jgi:hypothetical protein